MFDSMVRDLDAGGCAAAIVANQRVKIEQSCQELILAAHFADLYPAAGIVDPLVPGGDVPWRPGGEGTPSVASFCFAELAGLLKTTSGSATRLVADALDVRHRLPLTWRRVVACEIPGYLARQVAQATHKLSKDAAALVDVEIVDKLGAIPFARLLKCLQAAVMKADPERAQAEADQAAKDRFVNVSPESENGIKWIIARLAAGDAIFLDAMVARIADILGERGDTDTLDVRRSKALGILARPADAMQLLYEHSKSAGDPPADAPEEPQPDPEPEPDDEDDRQSVGTLPPPFEPAKARPKVVLYLHLSEEALKAGSGIARMEGVGPVLLSQLRDVLGDWIDITLQPVIDLNDTPAPVDSYEIPDRIREHLILRNPADQFPYAGGMARSPGKTCDVDHAIPYDAQGPPGQTRIDNLLNLLRFHHRVKTHGGVQVRQPEPGTALWRTPLGYVYLVNNSGTHALGHGAFADAVWRASEPGPVPEPERGPVEVFFRNHLTLAT